MCIITDEILAGAAWSQQVVTNVSRGKGDHAKVEQATQFTLAEFLKWQIDKRREGSMDATEYASASKVARNADKARAGWYSLATYANGHRDSKNWQGSNIAVLDADAKHGDEEGAQYSFTAAQLRARLDGLQYIALPTHSYTDEIPRWRIMIPLSEVITDRKEYSAIARDLAGRLDRYVDSRSYTPEQLWYSLSAPKGEWQRRIERIDVGG